MTQDDALFNHVDQSVMLRTMEGIINFWNHSAEKLYGWRKEEALGRVSHDLLQTQFPKPLEEIESELVRNGLWEGKLVHTTRDGGRVAVASRWTLDLKGQSGTVIEINRRSADREMDPKARTDTGSASNDLPAPAQKAHDLLPKIAAIVLAAGSLFCILGRALFALCLPLDWRKAVQLYRHGRVLFISNFLGWATARFPVVAAPP